MVPESKPHSFVEEYNELRAMQRRLKKLIKEYKQYKGYGVLEVSGLTVYEELLEVLNGEPKPVPRR